jgi:Icc-related predicted phosphoesterase
VLCFFATDLHGHRERYAKLFSAILTERPRGVFLGGDLLPSTIHHLVDLCDQGFVEEVLAPGLLEARRALGPEAPEVFLILGNDDGRIDEPALIEREACGVWHYAHGRRIPFGSFQVYGYSFVPPTPFFLKDWERYDVSRFFDPGCLPPEEGFHSHPVDLAAVTRQSIRADLEALAGAEPLDRAIFLFHAPPHGTSLDRAALDEMRVDGVPLDVHVGSIAIRRFLEARGPRVSLHGHVHEAARLTGRWKERIGRTIALSAAHDGPELALVRFDPEEPESATRELI